MDVLGILLVLILGCVLYWGVVKILAAFSIGEPISSVVIVVLVVLMVFALLGQLGYAPPLLLRHG